MRTGSRQDLGDDSCIQGDIRVRVLQGDCEETCSHNSSVYFLQNIVILGVLFVIFETVSGTNHTGKLTVN